MFGTDERKVSNARIDVLEILQPARTMNLEQRKRCSLAEHGQRTWKRVVAWTFELKADRDDTGEMQRQAFDSKQRDVKRWMLVGIRERAERLIDAG